MSRRAQKKITLCSTSAVSCFFDKNFQCSESKLLLLWLRLVAALCISVPAALTIAVCAVLLTADYIHTCRQSPTDETAIEQLEQQANVNIAHEQKLEAEHKRQTQVSLDRQHRNTILSNVLIVAAVLFLASAKWLIALNDHPPAIPRHILAQRAERITTASERPQETIADDEIAPVDLSAVDSIVGGIGTDRHAVIPILQAMQSHYRYLPQQALQRVCELTDITPAQIVGVASFYTRFRTKPIGEHLVKVCCGTACHVAGADGIAAETRRHLGIGPDSDTDPRRQFTIEQVACMGCCTLAPVVQIDDTTCGHVSPDRVAELLETHRKTTTKAPLRPDVTHLATDRPSDGEIRIGLGSCCIAGGSGRAYQALQQAVNAAGLNVAIKRVGCVGMCHNTPLMEVFTPSQPPALYAGVSTTDVRSIVARHFQPRRLSTRVTWALSTIRDRLSHNGDHSYRAIEVRDPPVAAFLGPQKHIATEHCGRIDPTDLDEYLSHDGFVALTRCLKEMTSRQVVDEIHSSGLRGRGGAGFPAADKWETVRNTESDIKYIICNGDEGDPGAFMDRMLMESFPYRILEGLAIAAYAVGASKGWFYIRAEYPLAVERIRHAIAECEKRNLLGNNILESTFSLHLQILQGAGAFVCGEETALVASLEGNRGNPRLRPPYPAERGLHGKPTLVSNVETWSTIPWILRNGASAFAQLGTAKSKGTKVFALAGKVKRGGLIEVPMGVTVRQIVEDIGGGIKDNRPFKAVQIGGPSGGCIPASLADTPVDFEAITKVGAIMGSGGLVVLDETDCMVDIARYFLTFTQDQSCGKCTYCRVGTRRMLDILDRLCEGQGKADDLDTLEQLAHVVRKSSLCGLGRTAPNPVLTTLRYFRDEYEAHLAGHCPAGKCKAIITYRITDDCIGCTLCAQHCPAEAIALKPYEQHEIDDTKCTRCDICRMHCPEDAICVE